MWASRLKEYFDAPRELERAQRILGDDLYVTAKSPGDVSTGPEHQFLFGPPSLQVLMRRSGITYRQSRNVFVRVCLAAIIVIALMIIFRSPWPLLLMGVSVCVEYMRVRKMARARAVNFERDYTAFLLSLASAVRTGLDPLVAVMQSDQLFAPESEVRKEITAFKLNIDRGMVEEHAILKFAESIEHPDVQLFRTAFILARREGSSLSLCLQRLARVTRQRQSFRRKVRAAVAMQKLSSIGIAGCAIVVGLFQSLTNPGSIREAFNHPLGIKLLGFGLFFMTLGLLWMMRMTRSKV